MILPFGVDPIEIVPLAAETADVERELVVRGLPLDRPRQTSEEGRILDRDCRYSGSAQDISGAKTTRTGPDDDGCLSGRDGATGAVTSAGAVGAVRGKLHWSLVLPRNFTDSCGVATI